MLQHAYVLVHYDTQTPKVLEKVRSLSLGNCLLVASNMEFVPGECLVVVSCDQPHALNAALGELATKVEGILEISVLRVVNRD